MSGSSAPPLQEEEQQQCKMEEEKPSPGPTRPMVSMFPGACAAVLEPADVSRSSTPDTPRSPSTRPVLPDDKLYCIWSEDGQLRLFHNSTLSLSFA